MTITELQAFVNTKPDLRELVNLIVDYIQQNTGGGGNPLVATDGTALTNLQLSGDISGNSVVFGLNTTDGSNNTSFISGNGIHPEVSVFAGDGISDAQLTVSGENGAGVANFNLSTTNTINTVNLVGDSVTNSLTYIAAIHTFSGKIINPGIVANNFANDAAAAVGGVSIGEFYHSSGTVKVRIV